MLTHGEHPGHDHGGGGIDVVARRQPAGASRRPRVHLQVEHGLDARHARVRARGSGPPPLAPQPRDVLDALHVHARTSSCRSRTTKSCTARARCSTRCRATCGRSTRRCARSTATCTAHPGQEAAVHGRRVRPVARVEPRSQPRLAPARRSGARRRCAATCRISTGTTSAEPALHERDFDPAGFRWIDCNDNENSVVSIVRYARDRARLRRDGLQLHAGAARAATGSACPRPATTPSCSTATASIYGGSNVGNGGGVDSRAGRRARLRSVAAPDGPAARVPAAEEALTDPRSIITKTRRSRSITKTLRFSCLRVLRALRDHCRSVMTHPRSRAVAVALVTFATFTDIVAYSIARAGAAGPRAGGSARRRR